MYYHPVSTAVHSDALTRFGYALSDSTWTQILLMLGPDSAYPSDLADDSKQTLLCTSLSGALLLGLLGNAIAGWWWADPVAALVIAVVAVREGLNAWRGDPCCASSVEEEK